MPSNSTAPSMLLEVKANLTPGHYVAPNVGTLIKYSLEMIINYIDIFAGEWVLLIHLWAAC